MSTALITGASRGFGLAVGSELAKLGWRLVIDSRNGTDLSAAAGTLEEAGATEVIYLVGDVTDPAHGDDLVSAAEANHDFELLVNNASDLGPSPLPRLDSLEPERLVQVIETNLVAPLRIIQRSLASLRSTEGVIVNVTSDAAVEAYEGWGGYGSSKAALEQLSHVLAEEEPLVRVYWFDPGDMQTQMHQDAFPGEDISDRPLPEARAPALTRLIQENPPSGRYSATDLLAGTGS